jgi:hypothetical protein
MSGIRMDGARHARPITESLNVGAGSFGQAWVIFSFVLDGLRPYATNPLDTPTLFRLCQEGVHDLDSHAV